MDKLAAVVEPTFFAVEILHQTEAPFLHKINQGFNLLIIQLLGVNGLDGEFILKVW